jgi:alpha-galactosidase
LNQDSLGRPARVVQKSDLHLVLAKPLADGSLAVGLFNRHPSQSVELGVDWSELKINGKQAVRDLWRHRDLADQEGQLKMEVGPHDVELFLLRPRRLGSGAV